MLSVSSKSNLGLLLYLCLLDVLYSFTYIMDSYKNTWACTGRAWVEDWMTAQLRSPLRLHRGCNEFRELLKLVLQYWGLDLGPQAPRQGKSSDTELCISALTNFSCNILKCVCANVHIFFVCTQSSKTLNYSCMKHSPFTLRFCDSHTIKWP